MILCQYDACVCCFILPYTHANRCTVPRNDDFEEQKWYLSNFKLDSVVVDLYIEGLYTSVLYLSSLNNLIYSKMMLN